MVFGIGLTLLPFSPSIHYIYLISLLFGIADGFMAPLQKSLITQNVPAQNRGGIVSYNSSFQLAGTTLAPVILEFIAINLGLTSVFYFLGITAVFFIPFFWFISNIFIFRLVIV